MRLPARLLRRRIDSSKGDYGHILILAGSLRYSGAALLCSEAAMRSGAGLVTLGLPQGICLPVIKRKLKEVMLLPLPQTKNGSLSLSGLGRIKDFVKNVDVVAIGPGLGQDLSTQRLVRKTIPECTKASVIDADCLNALAGHLDILRRTRDEGRRTILTPHPGEMSRLLGISVAEVQKNRDTLASKFAKDYRVTLVLKGHRTVISDYKGNFYLNKTGNPGMATAGSGDVLTGIITAFLGQGLDAFSAAKFAVYLHGLAGDLAAKEKTQITLIASDIIAKIPDAIKRAI
jgi:ADP-dependent NAD(P)H-hydrate dehydratase / NAD(P)H-hydrate epimerase